MAVGASASEEFVRNRLDFLITLISILAIQLLRGFIYVVEISPTTLGSTAAWPRGVTLKLLVANERETPLLTKKVKGSVQS